MTSFRTEADSLGPRQLPREAVWGIHTARALENFPITGVPLAHFPELVRALAMVKKAAALANRDLGTLDAGLAAAFASACDEIIAGRHHGIVSMDTATFDVTDAPAAVEGGFLELIGPRNPVDALAAQAGTIGYEILTSLGHRYARAYAEAGQIERLTA